MDEWGLRRGRDLVAESERLQKVGTDEFAAADFFAAGFEPEHPVLLRAVAWLERHQNADGGFGEDCRSYDLGENGRAWRGRGESTASQTAWALLGLVAAGAARSDCAARAAAWLCDTVPMNWASAT